MENANFKITSEDKRFLKALISAGNFKSLSEIYRTAISEFISKYTNRPTLMGLGQRQDRQQARLDRIEGEQRDMRAQIDKLKKLAETDIE